MQVTINGQQVSVPDEIRHVGDLLAHYELGNKLVVVEIDGVIADRKAYEATELRAGQIIEMVHFVGGG